MTLDELKRLRERLNDAGYAVIAETCRVLLDREIARMEPAPWTPAMGTQGTATPPPSVIYERKTNQGGGGECTRERKDGLQPSSDATAGSAHSPVVPDSAAAASFEERVRPGSELTFFEMEFLALMGANPNLPGEFEVGDVKRQFSSLRSSGVPPIDSLIESTLERLADLRWLLRCGSKYAFIHGAFRAKSCAADALAAKDAEIASLKSEGVEDLIRQRDEARREAAARAQKQMLTIPGVHVYARDSMAVRADT